ncbi:MAG: PAS domain-containing protein [bacterium]|nr:PAS domain-containing protein [bacterium]
MAGPVLPQDDIELQRHRLNWLIGLRWHGTGALVFSALIGRFLLGIHFSVPALLAVAACMASFNAYETIRLKTIRFDRWAPLRQVIFDVLSLTLILFITGGFKNPFFTFYFFQIILAWILLPPRQSVAMACFITLCFALQGWASYVIPVDMDISDEGLLSLGRVPFHFVGAPISFVATSAITAYFVHVIMRDLRLRELELRDARQRAELDLNKLDNILRRLETGLVVFDREGRLEWVNDRVRDWFGPEGEREDLACYRIAAAARGKRDGLLEKNERADATPYIEARLPTLASGTRDFEVIVSPIYSERGEPLQVIELILDVTDHKRRIDQWARAEKLAAIGQLAAGVAHEINTPLGTIRILAEEARDILDHDASLASAESRGDLDESLRTIHEQTTRCKNITQGLLNFSRNPGPAFDECSVNELAAQSIELVRPKIGRIEVKRCFESESPVIRTDPNQVKQALCNLLINAADALEGREDGGCIRVETRHENGVAIIRVIDNGPGVPVESLPHIFEPFYTTKPVGKGTGLGLYISYGAIRDLGGRLEIENQPDEGAAATITLPIQHER